MEEITTRIPLPKIIYETIEDVLEAYTRRLAIDIAKTLHVNEKLLLNELKKQKITAYLYEEINSKDIYDSRCNSFEKNGSLYVPCEEPIVYTENFCTKHMITHITKEELKEYDALYRLYYNDMKYYCDKKNIVYDMMYRPIGSYDISTKTVELIVALKNGS